MDKRKPEGLSLPTLEPEAAQHSGEPRVRMINVTEDGLAVGVPPEKLAAWTRAQEQRYTEPLSDTEQELKYRLLQRILRQGAS